MRLLLAAAGLTVAAAVAVPAGACPAAAAAQRQGFDAARLCAVLQAFASADANYHSLLVQRHGELVAEAYRRGTDRSIYSWAGHDVQFGPGTLHDLRSLSKSVTSLVWGIAWQQGKVPSPETAVATILPELTGLTGEGRAAIALADLLNMSSGLAWRESGVYNLANDETALYWRRSQASYVFGHAVAAAPGERFNYNGGNTAILAEILEQRTGMPLPDYANRHLFAPLGITDWEWMRDLRGRPLAFAGLRLGSRDLLKLGTLLLQRGRWQGRQVVPAAWVDASLQPRVATGDGLQYGYQWWMGSAQALGRTYRWTAGFGNGGQRLFVVPALDLAVVVTAGEYDNPSIGPRINRLLGSVVAAVAAP